MFDGFVSRVLHFIISDCVRCIIISVFMLITHVYGTFVLSKRTSPLRRNENSTLLELFHLNRGSTQQLSFYFTHRRSALVTSLPLNFSNLTLRYRAAYFQKENNSRHFTRVHVTDKNVTIYICNRRVMPIETTLLR